MKEIVAFCLIFALGSLASEGSPLAALGRTNNSRGLAPGKPASPRGMSDYRVSKDLE